MTYFFLCEHISEQPCLRILVEFPSLRQFLISSLLRRRLTECLPSLKTEAPTTGRHTRAPKIRLGQMYLQSCPVSVVVPLLLMKMELRVGRSISRHITQDVNGPMSSPQFQRKLQALASMVTSLNHRAYEEIDHPRLNGASCRRTRMRYSSCATL